VTFIQLFSVKIVDDSLTVKMCVIVNLSWYSFTHCKAYELSVIALAPADKSPHLLLFVPKNW